nr:efflux RND transporter periplasmic adaptor subunit [Planctomycetota bacterium]
MSTDRTDVVQNDGNSKAMKNIPGDGAGRTVGPQLAQTRETVEPARRPTRKKRRKRRRRLPLVFFLFSLAAVAVGWWWYTHRAPDEVELATLTATVARRDFSSSVLATGAVQAQVGAEVRVGARLSGRVERLYANIGDDVRKGQIVAELEKADLEAMVGQRQAELDLAQARLAAVEALLPKEMEKAQLDLDECQATYTLNEKELERQRQLHARGVATDEDLDEAEEGHSVSKIRVASA